MSNLIVEIGNTAVKAALAESLTLGKTFRYQGEKRIEFILSLIEREIPDFTVVAASYDLQPQDMRRLRKASSRMMILDPSNMDILERYSLPSYLSYDRAASVIAARHLFKGKACTVFDFGTTFSVDFINSDGSYEGGNISLGMRTRFKALNRYSKALPLLAIPQNPASVGKSRQSSLEAGVISGMVFEIQGYITDYPDNIVVFTGGDANYFAKRTKNSIFVVCNLALLGLAIIVDEYVQKNIQ